MSRQAVTVYVPGHVTAFFAARPHADPLVAGSIGAGITIPDGVEVRVEPDGSGELLLDNEPSTVAPVDIVLESLDIAVTVTATTDVPMGAGFGVSGGLALGVAIGAQQFADQARRETELIQLAHRAEVESNTGLGDVMAQAHGGAPIRIAPGAPGFGRMDGIPERERIEYLSFGDLSTQEVLQGDMTAINDAGTQAMETLCGDPSLDTLMDCSYQFARQTGFLTERVEDVIANVRSAGGKASMAMLGETVFGLGRSLSDAGYDPHVTRIWDGSIRVR